MQRAPPRIDRSLHPEETEQDMFGNIKIPKRENSQNSRNDSEIHSFFLFSPSSFLHYSRKKMRVTRRIVDVVRWRIVALENVNHTGKPTMDARARKHEERVYVCVCTRVNWMAVTIRY